jgi:hypothetical protein
VETKRTITFTNYHPMTSMPPLVKRAPRHTSFVLIGQSACLQKGIFEMVHKHTVVGCRTFYRLCHDNNNNNNNNKNMHAYAGHLNSITHIKALMVLHDRGSF